MIPDLSQTSVVVIVFAMHQCPACDEFLPRLLKRVAAEQRSGAPFVVWQPGMPLVPGQIPVLLYDAASEDTDLVALMDKIGIASTPTTCIMTHTSTLKVEGAMDEDEAARLLAIALRENG